MLVIFKTWACSQNQNFELGSYRIRSNLWVHGPIGACYPARDSKVETALVISCHFVFILLHISSSLKSPCTPCLAQITKRWRCVQPRICLCGHHSGCQVLNPYFLAKDYFCKFSTHEVFVLLPSLVILSDSRLNKKDVTFTSVVEDIWSMIGMNK